MGHLNHIQEEEKVIRDEVMYAALADSKRSPQSQSTFKPAINFTSYNCSQRDFSLAENQLHEVLLL